jgi:hypothetical protein
MFVNPNEIRGSASLYFHAQSSHPSAEKQSALESFLSTPALLHDPEDCGRSKPAARLFFANNSTSGKTRRNVQS